MTTADEVAAGLPRVPFDSLDAQARKVASHVAQRLSVASRENRP